MSKPYYVWVWRSGAIDFANRRAPDGALEVFRFADRRAAVVANRSIEVVSRLAYDNKTLLVPGIPEAEDDSQAIHALRVWAEQVKRRIVRTVPASRRTYLGVAA